MQVQALTAKIKEMEDKQAAMGAGLPAVISPESKLSPLVVAAAAAGASPASSRRAAAASSRHARACCAAAAASGLELDAVCCGDRGTSGASRTSGRRWSGSGNGSRSRSRRQ